MGTTLGCCGTQSSNQGNLRRQSRFVWQEILVVILIDSQKQIFASSLAVLIVLHKYLMQANVSAKLCVLQIALVLAMGVIIIFDPFLIDTLSMHAFNSSLQLSKVAMKVCLQL